MMDPNDMPRKEWQTLKGERERPVTLVRQQSCDGVYPEGEAWIAEALAGMISCTCLPNSP